MIATRRVWFVGILATLTLFVIIGTSTASSNQEFGESTNTKNAENDSDDKKGTFNSKEQKLIRIPLKLWNPRNRERRSFDRFGGTPNDKERNGDESKFDGNAIATNEKSSRARDISGNGVKVAKKIYKKLKLAQIQAGYNNPKNKERSPDQDLGKYMDKHLTKKIIERRHVNYFADENDSVGNKNRMNIDGSKPYEGYARRNSKKRDDDYYAQRKTIMEKFYARQREITKKYGDEVSKTPEYVHRYDPGRQIENNTVSSLAKIEREDIYKAITDVNNANNELTNGYVRPKSKTKKNFRRIRMGNDRLDHTSENDNNGDDDYEYYDEYEDNTVKPTENAISQNSHSSEYNDRTHNNNTDSGNTHNGSPDNGNTSTAKPEVITKSNATEWGNCTNGVGKLLYNHNLLLSASKDTMSEAETSASIDGSFCVTCIRVTPPAETKATVSYKVIRGANGALQTVKVMVKGYQGEELSFVVRIWIARKSSNHCTDA